MIYKPFSTIKSEYPTYENRWLFTRITSGFRLSSSALESLEHAQRHQTLSIRQRTVLTNHVQGTLLVVAHIVQRPIVASAHHQVANAAARRIRDNRAEVAGTHQLTRVNHPGALAPVLRPTLSGGGTCRLRGVFQVQVHGARFTGGHGDIAGQLLHARVVDALVLGHVHHAVIGGHEECRPRGGALRQTLQRRVQFLKLLQPFVTAHAVTVARGVNLAPVQVHGGRGAAGQRLQGVGDAGVVPDGVHEVSAAQGGLGESGAAVLAQRNGEHAAVRMVAFQHGRQRLPGVRVHRLIPAGQVVHDRARSPITSRVAHLVACNAVRAGCRAGAQRGQGGGGRGGERGVQRAQVQGLTQGGRVAAVAVEQLLAQAVHHDHAGVAERRRINVLLREAAGKVQRVGNRVERRVGI